jgi:quercetin dioxygenase-like cupin family protein
MSALLQREGLEVMAAELEPGAVLAEGYLWGRDSWHIVVAGQALFQQGDESWELLKGESLCLSEVPYTVVNPTPERTRLLSLLFTRSQE